MKKSKSKSDDPKSVSYVKLFRFASHKDKIYVFVGIISSVICGLIFPINVELTADFLQSITLYKASVLKGTPQKDTFYSACKKIAINYLYLGVATLIITYMAVLFLKLSSINQVHKIRIEYLTAILNQDFSYFDLNETRDFPNKMISNMAKFEEGVNEKLGFFFYYLTILIVSLILAFVKGWKLTLICMSVVPIIIITMALLSVIVNKMTIKEEEISTQASSILEEVLAGIRTVHAYSGQKKEYERYRLITRNLKKHILKKYLVTNIFNCIIYSNSYIIYSLAFWFGFLFILDGSYNMQKLMAVLIYVFNTFMNIQTLNQFAVIFDGARGSTASIFQLIDNTPTINPLKNEGVQLQAVKGDIELKNVYFHYPSRPELPILRGVSLTVKAGQVVAFIGHSGCGKSTTIQLISRYYDTIQGSVTLDGHDVKSLQVRWLREQIGYVRQEPVLFDTTIMENIRYGREDATRNEIIEAARLANAHDFIINLSDGYDTLVGTSGASMSGGQKQRIAIARALVRNPKILLLDEATSALDNVSEALVQDALDQAQKGRTTIMIAHRLTTVQNADLIYVFEKGNIIESGSPAELTESKGVYYKMMMTQGLEPNKVGRQHRLSLEKKAEQEKEVDIAAKNHYKKVSKEEKRVNFWEILALTRPECCYAMIAFIITVALSILNLVVAELMTQFVVAVAKYNDGKTEVREVSVFTAFLGILVGILTCIEGILYGICGERLLERLKLRLFDKYLSYDMEFYDNEDNSVGALCAKISTNISGVKDAVTDRKISVMLSGAALFIMTIVVTLIIEYKLGLVIAGFAPILLIVTYYEGKLSDSAESQTALGMEQSSKMAVEVVTNYQTVASLGRESIFVKEYAELIKSSLKASRKAAFGISLVYALSRSINFFISSCVFYYAGYIIVHESGSAETTFKAVYMIFMGAGALTLLFIYMPNIRKGIKACKHIITETSRTNKIKDPDPGLTKTFICDGSASFEDVKFKYPSRPHITVFDGVNLQIEQGKTTAIVGHSGCGKSTAIQLLMRYYDPDEGTVKQSGIPLPLISLEDFRRTIGLVGQEPILFDRTIGENIGYGLQSDPDMERIQFAAQQANIHSFVISLPQGYDTNVGKRGTQLSGGQKQRIALARALVRHPKLLLLDEATSNLDAESENVVQEALDKAKEGRTCVVIAHRLNTIRNADVICVLHHGRLAEQGTHDELMTLKGHYYSLHNTD